MDRLIELGQLCDYYGALLTERQRKLLSQYADENLSLAEIAELEGVSRQAVRDGIVHAEQTLQGFAQALHLMEKTRRTQEMDRKCASPSPRVSRPARSSMKS